MTRAARAVDVVRMSALGGMVGRQDYRDYRAGSRTRVARTPARMTETAAQAEIASDSPAPAARRPAPKGPTAKPRAVALAPTPKTRAWAAGGVLRPIRLGMSGPVGP